MPKYRRKPIVVDAVQWFKDGDHPAVGLCQHFYRGDSFWIVVQEKPVEVSPGDWIITGVNGEHYPCKPDVFEKTYEKV